MHMHGRTVRVGASPRLSSTVMLSCATEAPRANLWFHGLCPVDQQDAFNQVVFTEKMCVATSAGAQTRLATEA